MPTDRITSDTAELRRLGGQRVWSLMVSLFGDLLHRDGARMDGPVLSAIMAALNVRPEAVRVALHRLRNDGWIVSEKHGRISRHGLSEGGLRETRAAFPRVYATPGDGPRDWQLLLLPEAATDAPPGFTPLGPRIFVGPAEAPVPPEALALPGGRAPEWLQREVMPEPLAQDYETLAQVLTALEARLPEALPSRDRAVLRCLVVHNWRRLVLRHPPLPDRLLAADHPALRCGAVVSQLLARYPRPTAAEIAEIRLAA